MILGFVACASSSTEARRKNESGTEKVDTRERSTCEKCNVEVIKYASDNWDKLTKTEIEQFLCSYDEKCAWTTEMMETRENQKFGIAWDMLFVLFDKYFDQYLELFEENESISHDYLIKLFSQPAIYDLPHKQILTKLKNKPNKTEFQNRLEKAFEYSVAEGERIFNEYKE